MKYSMFKFCVLQGISSLQVSCCHETFDDLVIVGLINKGLPKSFMWISVLQPFCSASWLRSSGVSEQETIKLQGFEREGLAFRYSPRPDRPVLHQGMQPHHSSLLHLYNSPSLLQSSGENEGQLCVEWAANCPWYNPRYTPQLRQDASITQE